MPFFRIFKNKRKNKIPFCSVVIAAAGSSQRMEGENKLFIEICGMPVLAHTLLAFQNSSVISEIIVVVRDSEFRRISEMCAQYGIGKATMIMAGGMTRLESVMNGVLAVSKKARIIAIHDGARPCVDGAVIEGAVLAAVNHHAAAPAVPVNPTLKRAKNGIVLETVDRTDLYEIQTPQVFTAEIIKAALTKAANDSAEITDDCMAVELIGIPVHVTEGSRSNIKLTTGEDVIIAETILGRRGAGADTKAAGTSG